MLACCKCTVQEWFAIVFRSLCWPPCMPFPLIFMSFTYSLLIESAFRDGATKKVTLPVKSAIRQGVLHAITAILYARYISRRYFCDAWFCIKCAFWLAGFLTKLFPSTSPQQSWCYSNWYKVITDYWVLHHADVIERMKSRGEIIGYF